MEDRLTRWRHLLARWIDPHNVLPMLPPAEAVEAVGSTSVPRRVTNPADQGPDQAGFYAALSEQFAVRVLTGVYQMGNYLDAVEADEPDPARLEQLYRLDHAVNRTRRQAENLLVLAGRPVQDAGRQVTTLLDVIRASTSAVEHFARVRIGRVVDLAVVEFASDDLIRMLTELIDNGGRFSPPHSSVVVGAHMTETGSVLLRVEDSGFGIEPAQLDSINAALAERSPSLDFIGGPGHLGFAVVHRLAIVHGLRVQITSRLPGGITATILVPPRLMCEIPTAGPTPSTRPFALAQQRQPLSDSDELQPVPLLGQPKGPDTANVTVTAAGLPMRQPISLRESRPSAPPVVPPASGRHRSAWPDDAADFAAGIDDARYPDAQYSAESTNEGSPR